MNVYSGSTNGVPLASGGTDGNGNIAPSLTFSLAFSAQGAYTLTVMDSASRYPAT